VPPVLSTSALAITAHAPVHELLTQGASLPLPAHRPFTFQATLLSAFMTMVLWDMEHEGLIQEQDTVNAFCYFLVWKPVALLASLWTLYAVLLPPADYIISGSAGDYGDLGIHVMVKLDLSSGFFQLSVWKDCCKYYGICYEGRQLSCVFWWGTHWQ
jgi:hypothetical protein